MFILRTEHNCSLPSGCKTQHINHTPEELQWEVVWVQIKVLIIYNSNLCLAGLLLINCYMNLKNPQDNELPNQHCKYCIFHGAGSGTLREDSVKGYCDRPIVWLGISCVIWDDKGDSWELERIWLFGTPAGILLKLEMRLQLCMFCCWI